MKALLSAVAFLTRLPVSRSLHTEEIAAGWFPLAGLLLGGLYWASAHLFRPILPANIIAVLLLIEDALLTGALHLDGLADMADGFGGGRTREDVLRIMRDHAIGSYGAVALIAALVLKFVCLADLIAPGRTLWFLFTVPVFSRWSLVLLSVLQPYARTDGTGTGALATSITRKQLVLATLFCIPVLILCGWRRSLAGWATTVTVTLVTAAYAKRRIGGITGDVLGANLVACEVFQMLVASFAAGPTSDQQSFF